MVHENIKLESDHHLKPTTNLQEIYGTYPILYLKDTIIKSKLGNYKINNLVFPNKSIASREKESQREGEREGKDL